MSPARRPQGAVLLFGVDEQAVHRPMIERPRPETAAERQARARREYLEVYETLGRAYWERHGVRPPPPLPESGRRSPEDEADVRRARAEVAVVAERRRLALTGLPPLPLLRDRPELLGGLAKRVAMAEARERQAVTDEDAQHLAEVG